MSWSRHLRLLISVLILGLLGSWLFVFAMNPYGNLPPTVLPRHVIMDDNQRYQYPAIIRSRQFDSALIGTSTARLISPAGLERIFGGRFANLALNDGTAWEQSEIAKLFERTVEQPRTLMIGLDTVWCRANADQYRITRRGFPEWIYDDDPWNDLAYLLNVRALEISGRRLAAALGLAKPRWPNDGFEIFTPPESAYDLEKARSYIYGNGPRSAAMPQTPPYVPAPAEPSGWRYPALDWLEARSHGKFGQGALVFMPVHQATQPRRGTIAEAQEAECKRRIAGIGERRGWPVIDFRIHSAITREDSHYWDPLHYRLSIAARVEDGLARAIKTGRDDPKGDWKVLFAPRRN